MLTVPVPVCAHARRSACRASGMAEEHAEQITYLAFLKRQSEAAEFFGGDGDASSAAKQAFSSVYPDVPYFPLAVALPDKKFSCHYSRAVHMLQDCVGQDEDETGPCPAKALRAGWRIVSTARPVHQRKRTGRTEFGWSHVYFAPAGTKYEDQAMGPDELREALMEIYDLAGPRKKSKAKEKTPRAEEKQVAGARDGARRTRRRKKMKRTKEPEEGKSDSAASSDVEAVD
mgnify:FL=1